MALRALNKSGWWFGLHTLVILSIGVSLFTGLRIATQHRDVMLSFTHLLPQGNMHAWHFASALLLFAVAGCYLIIKTMRFSALSEVKRSRYHQSLIYLVYLVISVLILSGISLYTDLGYFSNIRDLHFIAALLMLFFVFAHGFYYTAQLGFSLLLKIFLPAHGRYSLLMSFSSVLLALTAIYQFDLFNLKHRDLNVTPLPTGEFIDIDGYASESVWQQAERIKVMTSGGANFVNGATEVSVQAVRGTGSIYFYISWDDASQSLAHLPLEKTEQGWKVLQNGFHHFDERTYYEDKFAIMVSDHCEPAGAGTAHLGHQPHSDRPANWHGRGYHYTTNNQAVDLWHWKAVRTNRMRLMDDNFIGEAYEVLPGSRRYTAGYRTDIKESGSYVMNWKWYKPTFVVPKRLPKNAADIQAYQDIFSPQLQWAIPWFEYQPYKEALDNYPLGTILPSVMYSTNRFEGDRANVNAVGRWENGKWHLEISRNLNTHSDQDVEIKDGTCIWVSAFDHSQTAHTRHNYALKLNFR